MNGNYILICDYNELEEGSTIIVKTGDTEILLAKDQGEIYAVGAYCSHDGGRMEAHEVIDGQVECPRHGAMFDIRTGKPTLMPAVFGIDTYPVKVENGQIFLHYEE